MSIAPALRPALPGDLDALVDLAIAFYAEDGFRTTAETIRANLELLIDSDTVRSAVIESQSTIVAFAITTSHVGLENGPVAELEDLYVVPAQRHCGHATRLIEDSAQWAAGRGCTVLDVVIAPNGLDVAQLFGFYRARGFRDDGRRLVHRALSPVPHPDA